MNVHKLVGIVGRELHHKTRCERRASGTPFHRHGRCGLARVEGNLFHFQSPGAAIGENANRSRLTCVQLYRSTHQHYLIFNDDVVKGIGHIAKAYIF